MIAVEYDHYGNADVIALREVPAPVPKAEEVLVRVHAAALNPKDALVRAGKFKHLAGHGFPKRMGLDFAGEVVEPAGDFKVGQKVFGMIQSWRAGAFAEFAAVPEDQLAAMPESLAYHEAAALPLAALTALQAMRDLARVGEGAELVIHGASGGVGTLAVQIAKNLGAKVTALCGEEALPMVSALGADAVFNYRHTFPAELQLTCDAFFDVFGNQSFAAVKHLLKPSGCYVSTVPSPRNIRDDLLKRFSPFRRARLVIVRSKRADLETLAGWVNNGQLKPVIAARLPLSEMRQAHELIQSKRTHGKIVFDIP